MLLVLWFWKYVYFLTRFFAYNSSFRSLPIKIGTMPPLVEQLKRHKYCFYSIRPSYWDFIQKRPRILYCRYGWQLRGPGYNPVYIFDWHLPVGYATVRRDGEPDDQRRARAGVHETAARVRSEGCKYFINSRINLGIYLNSNHVSCGTSLSQLL